ncbi:MAG: hypothetical protein L6R37_005012 [Teloschistes peruensis]|nr:MAG: hypothetical protein L6R37_005012 [Teloschistes peruensis]
MAALPTSRLDGKVIVVTGSVKATVIQADVSDPQQIAELSNKGASTFGKLDIVVSNAGIEHFAHISEVTAEDVDKVFAITTHGQLLIAKQAWKHCNDGGRLIMVSSVGANAKGINNHAIYSASKASIEAFARSLAVDFGPREITVNAIAPGGVKTDLFWETVRRYVPASMSDDMAASTAASGTPLNCIGEPEDIGRVVAFLCREDIGRVVAFLCREDGGWMNGQILTISGALRAFETAWSPWRRSG